MAGTAIDAIVISLYSYADEEPRSLKPVRWIGSSYKDFCSLPHAARSQMGSTLFVAQRGEKHRDAKPLSGFSGAGVLEIMANQQGDTFRAMYTVRFGNAVYVLHAFQKKSKSGIATPKADLELVRQRLKEAELLASGEKNE
jgi:phage-related protein